MGIRAKLERFSPTPAKIHTMPIGLERRHNTGQLHFITFSCYRRLLFLEDSSFYGVSFPQFTS
jgi:hypothetical protein